MRVPQRRLSAGFGRGNLPNRRDLARLGARQLLEQFGDERTQVDQSVGQGTQHDHGDRESGQVLLEGEIAVDRDERIELARRESEQITVLDRCPSHRGDRPDFVPGDILGEATIHALIEQHSHASVATILDFASSRKAITWSRLTVGKPSRKSSIDSPFSR